MVFESHESCPSSHHTYRHTFLLPRPRAAFAFLPCLISLPSATPLFLNTTLPHLYYSMAAASDNPNLCSTLASQLPGQISYAQDPIATAANIENAVTINLSKLNDVSLGVLGPSCFQNDTDFCGGPMSSSAAGSHLVEANDSDPSLSVQSFVNFSSDTTGEKSPLNSPNILSAGGGATWCDVYKKLDSTGLIAIGGRGTSLG